MRIHAFKNRVVLRLSAFILLPLIAGCLQTRNVTSSDRYESDYVQGGVYELQQEANLQERERRGWLDEAMLDLPPIRVQRPGYGSVPSVGTLAVGTQLRFERLVHFSYFEGTEVFPVARITQGPQAGLEVDIRSISAPQHDTHGFRTRVDPVWLKLVVDPSAK